MTEIAIGVLSEKLKSKRAGQGVRAVAKQIGISAATYSRVENGKIPDLETFRKLCLWVAIDPNEILAVPNTGASSTPRALVHFKNDDAMRPELARALGEMILKAQQAMREDLF